MRGEPGMVERAGVVSAALVGTRRLTYWRCGPPDAPTLLMLHGLGSDHRGLLDLAARLTGRQLVVPDLPGFGHSDPLPGEHTLTAYAAALDELRRELGLSSFALLGHSLGADVALTYAATYRSAVSDLCLLNPIVSHPSVSARLGEVYCRVGAALPGPVARALLCSRPAVYVQDLVALRTSDRATRRRILDLDYVTARLAVPRAVSESVRSLRESPVDSFAESLRARTLVVTGARDPLSTSLSITRLPWAWPRPDVLVLPGAGHLLPAEHPDEVADIVEGFLDAAITSTA